MAQQKAFGGYVRGGNKSALLEELHQAQLEETEDQMEFASYFDHYEDQYDILLFEKPRNEIHADAFLDEELLELCREAS